MGAVINVSDEIFTWDTVVYCTLRRMVNPDVVIYIIPEAEMCELVPIPGYTFIHQGRLRAKKTRISYDLYKTPEVKDLIGNGYVGLAHVIKKLIEDKNYVVGCALDDRSAGIDERIAELAYMFRSFGKGGFISALEAANVKMKVEDNDRLVCCSPHTTDGFIADYLEATEAIRHSNDIQRPWLLFDRILRWQYPLAVTQSLTQYVGEPKDDGYHIYCKEIPPQFLAVGKAVSRYEIVVRDIDVARWLIENTPLNMVRIFGKEVCSKMNLL